MIFNFDKVKKNKENFKLIFSVNIENEIKILSQQITLSKKVVNDLKGISKNKYFINGRDDELNTLSNISELCFNFEVYNLNNLNKSNVKEKIIIKECQLFNVNLEKEREDFFIKIIGNKETKDFHFDIKSQYLNRNKVNVNCNAHKRFLEHKADFYLICLVECEDYNNINTAKKAHYIAINKDYFNKNAVKKINVNRNSEYFEFDINKIKQTILTKGEVK